MINKGKMNEAGLENSIIEWLVTENGYERGTNDTFDKQFAIDTEKLFRFLETTQADNINVLNLNDEKKKLDFLTRLSNEISKRGIIDVLKNGIRVYPAPHFILFYLTPSEKNPTSIMRFTQNIFSITNQLNYF